MDGFANGAIRGAILRHVAAPLFYVAVAVWGVAALWVSITDWREGRIPKVVVWSAALVVCVILLVVSLLLDNPGRFGLAVLGGAAVGAFMVLFYFLRPGVIGFGDVRLVALNGLLGGWWGLEWAWWSLFAGVFAMLPIALVKALATAWSVKRRAVVKRAKEDAVKPLYAASPTDESDDIPELVEEDAAKPPGAGASEGASSEDGASGREALKQAWHTTLRAGPWLCAGTAAVVVFRWVEVGVV